MKNSASISIKGCDSDLLFEWLDYDGDDCFNDFHIVLSVGNELRRFDFGPCAVRGLKKFAQFFKGKLETVSSGFRFPDIRNCELIRVADGFQLQVRFEANDFSEQIHISEPAINIEDEFLKEYYGDL
ncbi:hypothetical protein ACFPT7_18215 [Acidicapsa dinghuensis]|uniref:Uncharacterized protein n=1 Tax=Acidicapsa dinghuensis TaxID=2218256 RepID=A0ABW1EIY5_9BACT|nr:hypothetical protein [Acidicapsa dinghuensis]